MRGYTVLVVEGRLAIQWEDETLEEAVERARAQQRLNSRAPQAWRELCHSRIR
jgi:hypothetical protein